MSLNHLLETFHDELELVKDGSKRRRQCSVALKQAVVQLLNQGQVSRAEVASAIGVHVTTVSDWTQAALQQNTNQDRRDAKSGQQVVSKVPMTLSPMPAFAPVHVDFKQTGAAARTIVIETASGTKIHIPV